MKIYIVFGATGEYSEREEWPVVAFFDEEKAKERVQQATKKANEIHFIRTHSDYVINERSNEFDPKMQTDYDPARYYYVTTEIGDYDNNTSL